MSRLTHSPGHPGLRNSLQNFDQDDSGNETTHMSPPRNAPALGSGPCYTKELKKKPDAEEDESGNLNKIGDNNMGINVILEPGKRIK